MGGDETVAVHDSDSDESILELEKPKKPPPLLIELEEEQIVINVSGMEPNSGVEVSKLAPPIIPVPKTSHDNLMNPYHWTQDMVQFYNEEKDNNEFIVENICNKMDSCPRLWTAGVLISPKNRKRQPCFNCGGLGHDERRCRPTCCVMCGADNHISRFCPRKICLSCGKKCHSFVASCMDCSKKRTQKCTRCGIRGHVLVDCPDHWRRFHHVTTLTTVVPPDVPAYKDKSEFWCCNCARKGHIEADCHFSSVKDFGLTSRIVSSYERGFAFDKADLGTSGGGASSLPPVPSPEPPPLTNSAKKANINKKKKNKRYFDIEPQAGCSKRKPEDHIESPASKKAKTNANQIISISSNMEETAEFISLCDGDVVAVDLQPPIPTNNPGIFIVNEKLNQAGQRKSANRRKTGVEAYRLTVEMLNRSNKRKKKPKNQFVIDLVGNDPSAQSLGESNANASTTKDAPNALSEERARKHKNRLKSQQRRNKKARRRLEEAGLTKPKANLMGSVQNNSTKKKDNMLRVQPDSRETERRSHSNNNNKQQPSPRQHAPRRLPRQERPRPHPEQMNRRTLHATSTNARQTHFDHHDDVRARWQNLHPGRHPYNQSDNRRVQNWNGFLLR